MSILLTASESASAGSMIPLILMYVVDFWCIFLLRTVSSAEERAEEDQRNAFYSGDR